MNKRFIAMLSIALMLSGLAAWIANSWIQGRAVPEQAGSVVVAAMEIPFGVKLEESQIKVIPWADKSLPQGAYASKDQVVNRVTMNKFYPDEIITEKRISEHLGGSTLSALITKEYRAISVRVDDVVGVAGFILPGNRVDILATKMDRENNKASTHTQLQNVKVLAVDQEASQDKEKPSIVRAVTLELRPDQAEIVTQAMQEGTIQLTLRNPLDNELEETEVKVAEAQAAPVADKPARKTQSQRRALKIIPWS